MYSKKNTMMPLLAAVTGNLFWGLSYLFLTMGMRYASTPVLLSVRFLLAFGIMTLAILFGKQKLSFKGKMLRPILLLAVLEPTCFYLETYGLQYTNVTTAGVILATAPVLSIAAAAFLLNEYPRKVQALCCLLPVIGVILCTLSERSAGAVSMKGILLLIADCFLVALYRIANRKASEYTPFERTYIVLGVCAVVFTAHALISTHGSLAPYREALSHPGFVVPVIILVVFCSIAANLLVNRATSQLSVAKISSLGTMQTVVSTLSGIVILSEPASPMTIAGAGVIILGIILVTKTGNPAIDQAPQASISSASASSQAAEAGGDPLPDASGSNSPNSRKTRTALRRRVTRRRAA